MIEVAIIGLGPWGLSALERLLDGLSSQETERRGAVVHVIEPGRAGSGVYSVDQPDYFILNTPCGQHSMHPFPEQSRRFGFFEWAQAQGYRWVGDRCQITPSGRPITPADFLPRRLMGEYLEWFYADLVAGTPAGIRVVHHHEYAVDITETAAGEQIQLANGDCLEVDFAILATGHTENVEADLDLRLLPPYPQQAYSDAIAPGSNVAVSGMGLVSVDVVIALTRGRGGEFVGEDRLRYRRSGREPVVHLFSRTGEPYRAKSHGTEDPTGEYIPSICTRQAIEAARSARRRATGCSQIDMRADVLPLIIAEMELRYYEQAARLRCGAEGARAAKADLTNAWASGRFRSLIPDYGAKYGFFDAATAFFHEDVVECVSSKDYEAHVYSAIADDLSEALVRGGASPVKAAQEVLRVLRDTMRDAVEFRSLTGPPAFRCQQLLALMDAEILRAPFGPAPTVTATAAGGFRIASERLAEPIDKEIDVLVRGHLDDPTCERSGSPLLQNLYRNGRIRELAYGPVKVGSLDLSTDLNPVSRAGEPQRRLFILGALTEGVRYFTAYVPSPKSRVRAFVDAQACVERILAPAS
jgi:uncharacterized NAD(P)/FAD-binding protein YdhS